MSQYFLQSIDYLNTLINYETRGTRDAEFNLEKLQKIYDGLFEKDKTPVIHIAGTKGKGSTAAFISSVLQTNRSAVGVFSSPHLTDIRERFTVNDELISKDLFAEIVFQKIKPLNDELTDKLTYFEILTLLAFFYFRLSCVDYIVAEVGLGGRLDATNVVTPTITAITNIALDHTEILGSTVEKIAYEKAGIIKRGVPIITTETQDVRALNIIKEIAEYQDAPLIIASKYEGKLTVIGQFQQSNAGIAAAIAKQLGIAENIIHNGITNRKINGRMEDITNKISAVIPISKNKKIIFDGAHNPFAMNLLIASLKQEFPHTKIDFIIGVLRDKDWQTMIDTVLNSGIMSGAIFVNAPSPRGVKKEELLDFTKAKAAMRLLTGEIEFQTANSLFEAIRLSANDNDTITVITGSLYLYADL